MIAAPLVLTVRAVTPGGVPMLEQLIERSTRQLSQTHYTAEQIEAAIAHVFGVDGELIADTTYLVAKVGEDLAGCGGWSRRRTLFGDDRLAGRTGGLLDPAMDAARIRAFFVEPRQARQGVGQALLKACASSGIPGADADGDVAGRTLLPGRLAISPMRSASSRRVVSQSRLCRCTRSAIYLQRKEC